MRASSAPAKLAWIQAWMSVALLIWFCYHIVSVLRRSVEEMHIPTSRLSRPHYRVGHGLWKAADHVLLLMDQGPCSRGWWQLEVFLYHKSIRVSKEGWHETDQEWWGGFGGVWVSNHGKSSGVYEFLYHSGNRSHLSFDAEDPRDQVSCYIRLGQLLILRVPFRTSHS